MLNSLVNGNSRPIIVIDWSGLTRCGKYYFLRAAITIKGGTLTLYERCYHISEYAKYKTHKNFLNILYYLLPNNCQPIIVTDAGFRNNWFKLVQSFGWDFIGRIRHNIRCKKAGDLAWKPVKNLYAAATHRAKFLLAQQGSLRCYFYLLRRKKLYRVKRNLVGKKVRCSVSLKHTRNEREPWLIATSINPATISAAKIMIIYKKRMQIEESFRDLKNTSNGFNLRHCRSFGNKRLDVALLIGTMAMFVLYYG